MKPLILCLVFFTLPTFVIAQKKEKTSPFQTCHVTIDQVPLIRGLRLGHPYTALQNVLPRRLGILGERPDEFGVTRLTLAPSHLSSPEQLKGVKYLSLVYFDNSLVSIDITYTNDVPWESNPHFVAAIAQQLKLPRDGWLQKDPAYLFCKGFAVRVSDGTILPSLHIVDSRFADDVKERKAQIEEHKRQRFRP